MVIYSCLFAAIPLTRVGLALTSLGLLAAVVAKNALVIAPAPAVCGFGCRGSPLAALTSSKSHFSSRLPLRRRSRDLIAPPLAPAISS